MPAGRVLLSLALYSVAGLTRGRPVGEEPEIPMGVAMPQPYQMAQPVSELPPEIIICGWPKIAEVPCRLLGCQYAVDTDNNTACVKKKGVKKEEVPNAPEMLSSSFHNSGVMPEAAPQGRQPRQTADLEPGFPDVPPDLVNTTYAQQILEDRWQNSGFTSLHKEVVPHSLSRLSVDQLPTNDGDNGIQGEWNPVAVTSEFNVDNNNKNASNNSSGIGNGDDDSLKNKGKLVICNSKFAAKSVQPDGSAVYNMKYEQDHAGKLVPFRVEHSDIDRELKERPGTAADGLRETPKTLGLSPYGGNSFSKVLDDNKPVDDAKH